MIPKMSSQDLNEEFSNKKEKIDEITLTIQEFQENINKKLMVLNYIMEATNRKCDVLGAGISVDKTLISFENNLYNSGMFEQYAYEIHPKFKSTPIDIFNLSLPNGGSMFKQSMTCTVNGINSKEWITVLQTEDNPNKKIVFDEYYSDTVVVEYTLDNTMSWGTSRFNVIEVDPYMPGMYDIESIECYGIDTKNIITNEPIKTISNVNNIGKTRIILDEKIKFSKIRFTFKNNFKSDMNGNAIYPFGIKHILFKEADFVSNSTAIIQATFDEYVEYVYSDITLHTVNEKINTTCDAYGIEAYATYENGTLLNKIKLSSSAGAYRIAKNTRSIYFKVPLLVSNIADDSKIYLCLNGLKINVSTKDILII